jgi:hypothetical protein
MAICAYFAMKGMTAEKYDEVNRRLEAAGEGAPTGRSYHCVFEAEAGLHVFDVFDSQEEFEALGEMVAPILDELGIDPGEPVVSPVHNVVGG